MAAFELDLDELSARLAPVRVENIRPLTGGASSLTYSATMATDGDRRVVVKVAPPGVPPTLNRDVLRQARVLRALGPTAVPVPEVLWEDAGEPPDVPPLFVMSFVEGSSGEPLFDLHGSDEPAVMAERVRDAARTLAALHALRPTSLGLTDEPHVGPHEEIERWCRLLETIDPALVPDWTDAADALRATEPAGLPDAVVHGDFRMGNLLASGPRITALIDWEIWAVGDPRVDVGWFLMYADGNTFQRPSPYAGWVPSPPELAAIYCDTLERDVPDLRWFQGLASFKSAATWALIIKHNRRRSTPDPAREAMSTTLPHLLTQARELAG